MGGDAAAAGAEDEEEDGERFDGAIELRLVSCGWR